MPPDNLWEKRGLMLLPRQNLCKLQLLLGAEITRCIGGKLAIAKASLSVKFHGLKIRIYKHNVLREELTSTAYNNNFLK